MDDTRRNGTPEPTARDLAGNVDDELAFHLEERARELVDEGWDAKRARLEARRRFGDLRQVKRAVERIDGGGLRARRRAELFGQLRQDLKIATRRLRKSPGFSLVAIATLALGIGANSAIFSVVNTVMLRPLPYAEPDRLVQVWESEPSRGWDFFAMSQPNYLDYRDEQTTFQQLAAIGGGSFNLTGDNEAERLAAGLVSANFLPLLGIEPQLGRGFTAAEDGPGEMPLVAMLGDGLWQRRFAADPEVVGRTVTLDGIEYTIVGVLPAGERWLQRWDVAVPLNASRDRNRGDHRLAIFGRLRDNVTASQAEADLDTIAARLAIEYPDSNAGFDTRLMSLYDSIVDADLRSALLILVAAVGCVLLIACANIANLLLARAAGQQRELAICAALGASRGRMIRQMLAESVLLAMIGGTAGVLIGYFGVGVLRSLDPDQIPRLGELQLDGSVLAFTFAVSIITGLVAGVVPAWQTADRDTHAALQEGSRGTSSSRRAGHTRKLLLASEVAVSVVLLVAAGLLIRSFWRVQSIDPGLDTDRVLTIQINVPITEQSMEEGTTSTFYRTLLSELRGLPAIDHAAAISGLPFGGGATSMDLAVVAAESPTDGSTPSAYWRIVTPGYFEALRIPLVRGRFFVDADDIDGPQSVVISQRMAERYWPGQDPIGERFLGWRDPEREMTVIGVAGDVRERSLEADAANIVYMPFYRYPFWPNMYLVLRGEVEPAGLVADVRTTVARIAPDLPLSNIEPLDAIVAESLAQRRFNTSLLGGFAALALALAAGGVYGVMAYSVARRGPEIGIRMAMGAQARQVVRMVITQGMRVVAVGGAVGIVAALLLTRVLSSLLFEVEPHDPLSMSAAVGFLALVALLACTVPAIRATRVDPARTLRND